MARDAGGVRRASATVHHAEPVSRRSGDPGGGERQYPSQTERDGVAPATGLRQLLAGGRAMAATAAGGVLGIPAVVRSKCDGGVVGGRLCGGGKRSTLSLLGSHCGAQARLVSASAGAMAGLVPGAV